MQNGAFGCGSNLSDADSNSPDADSNSSAIPILLNSTKKGHFCHRHQLLPTVEACLSGSEGRCCLNLLWMSNMKECDRENRNARNFTPSWGFDSSFVHQIKHCKEATPFLKIFFKFFYQCLASIRIRIQQVSGSGSVLQMDPAYN